MFLEDLLGAKDFLEEVEKLARDFRQKHSLPKIHQLGLVTESVERSAKELEEKGIGPFFLAEGSPIFWKERGKEKEFTGKMGLAYFKGIELELLEPGEGSDFYRQSLDLSGKVVVQHLGFLVPDVDSWAEKLIQEGYELWVRGRLGAGPLRIDFAYMDTAEDAGIIIEFISWRLVGLKFNPRPGLVHFLGRLEKWSGKRCWKM